jgi:hypothetical protein
VTPKGREISIEEILDTVWATAAQRNPMLLASLRQDYSFRHLRSMISDCIARGLSVGATIDHAVNELLRTAAARTQPSSTCDNRSASPS